MRAAFSTSFYAMDARSNSSGSPIPMRGFVHKAFHFLVAGDSKIPRLLPSLQKDEQKRIGGYLKPRQGTTDLVVRRPSSSRVWNRTKRMRPTAHLSGKPRCRKSGPRKCGKPVHFPIYRLLAHCTPEPEAPNFVRQKRATAVIQISKITACLKVSFHDNPALSYARLHLVKMEPIWQERMLPNTNCSQDSERCWPLFCLFPHCIQSQPQSARASFSAEMLPRASVCFWRTPAATMSVLC